MIFKPRGPRARLIRPADAGYASGVNPANYDISTAAGLRLVQCADPQDITDALEVAYLLAAGAAFARPYVSIVAGVAHYLAADGVTPIDPSTLPAPTVVEVAGLAGFGPGFSAFNVQMGVSPGGYSAPLPENLGPANFPRWFGLTL